MLVVALGAAGALTLRGHGALSARSASAAVDTVGGHAITYLPAQPYALSRGTGTCSTARPDPDHGCWAPTVLKEQPVYTAGATPGPASTQLRLNVGGPPPDSEPVDDGFTTSQATIGNKPATVRTMPNVVQLFFTLPDGTHAAVVALNIPVDEVEAFAEGVR